MKINGNTEQENNSEICMCSYVIGTDVFWLWVHHGVVAEDVVSDSDNGLRL